MANTGGQGSKATQFQPGKSGNPAGRPRGSKGRLIEEFLKALLEDFIENGKEAIKTARERSPVQYLRLVALLIPKAWFGEDEEGQPLPLPIVIAKREHQMVRSPHAFR